MIFKKINDLKPKEKSKILQRADLDLEEIHQDVVQIIEDVKKNGDKAIINFYRSFHDNKCITEDSLKVKSEEIGKAYDIIDEEDYKALKISRKNIKKFHESQVPKEEWYTETTQGVIVGQIWRPLESIGLYVPGGRAAYPSTALMTGIPAKVVDVPKVVATTPPDPEGNINPYTLVALDMAGVEEIYKAGGAHAIAALAYGTNTISEVEKVFGPGNKWVTSAKSILRNKIDIDFIAGPSEVLILATEDAKSSFLAWDLISQSEHDPNSSAVLVTTSDSLAKEVYERSNELLDTIERSNIVSESLEKYGAILKAKNLDDAIEFANEYAPEHLEVIVSEDKKRYVLNRISNAGSIFLGHYTPVPMGDYSIGGNHVLPTSKNAKRRGSLSVSDYIKEIDIQEVSSEGMKSLGPYASRIARLEGLKNHSESIESRIKILKDNKDHD